MASGFGVEKEWRRIEEEITCSICGNLFADPKTISCLHTFCKQCIERSIESNKKMEVCVCCPLCRAPIPQDEIVSIPTNFTMNHLVEIFNSLQVSGKSSMEMKCGNCETENLPVITWCVECEDPFCHDCTQIHKKVKAFKSHSTLPIDQFLRNPKRALAASPEKIEICKFHTKQTLDLYCKTCNSLICRDCTLKDHPRGHRDHDFDFVYEVVDEEREKMRRVIIVLKQLLERVRNGIMKIEYCEKQVDMKSEANIEKIRATYGEVYKLLQQQEDEIIGKVNIIKVLVKDRFSVQKESAKVLESKLVDCNEFSEKIVTVNKTRQLLTYNKWVENRVDELKKQLECMNFDREYNASDTVVRCSNPVEFVNDLVCDVYCGSDCTVTGPIVISDQVKLVVTLKDNFGCSLVNQLKDLEIRCNDQWFLLQNIHIEEESRGQYHIWYNPKRMEDHSLSVYWRGSQVNLEEIKVSVSSIRDYTKLNQEVKVIDKYGPANKHLTFPYLLAKGPDNELIVRDYFTKQLVVFDKYFQYSHVIGGAGNGNGRFQYITGIAVDKKGYVYVADGNLHHIQKIELNGKFISQFGSEGDTHGQFQSPYGLALSQSGLLFVCDRDNNRIQVFQNEQFQYCFGQHGMEPGSFNAPRDLALNNSEDRLFITEHRNHRVQMFTLKGQFLKIFGNFIGVPFKLQNPQGIHCTPDGHLLISSSDTHYVLVFDEDGTFTSVIEGILQRKEIFRRPCGVIMMDNGQIVIADNSTTGNKLVVF